MENNNYEMNNLNIEEKLKEIIPSEEKLFIEGIQYDPDSSPYVWEEIYKKVDLLRTDNNEKVWEYWKIFDFYKLDKVYNKQRDAFRVQAERKNIDEISDDFSKFKNSFFQTLAIAGDTAFNFKKLENGKDKLYSDLKKKIVTAEIDCKKKFGLLDQLEMLRERHHCLENFTLMLVTGKMQLYKADKADRFDCYIRDMSEVLKLLNNNKEIIENLKEKMSELSLIEEEYRSVKKGDKKEISNKIKSKEGEIKEILENKFWCNNKLLERASDNNRPALIIFLSLFENINDYCYVMYGIDEELTNKLCNSGKREIVVIKSDEEEKAAKEITIEEFLEVVLKFWKARKNMIKKECCNVVRDIE